MRFREFIRESYDQEVEEVVALIRERAQPWLAASFNGEFTVYRGLGKRPRAWNFEVIPVRTDRKPIDTPQLRHDMFNAMIAAAGGYANRSNSAFASSRYVAKSYGQVSVFIPLGEFRYTYSTKWHDWTTSVPWGEIINLLTPGSLQKIKTAYCRDSEFCDDPADISIDEITHALYSLSLRTRGFDDVENPMHMGEIAPQVLNDSKSYEYNKIRQVIVADRNLTDLPTDYEIMIAAKEALYIDEVMYKEHVLPSL